MYIATVQDMLANAYNNWRKQHVKDKITVVPQTTLAANVDFYRQYDSNWGYTTISLDCITSAELKTAMEWYRTHTDWSAFNKRDWQAAMDSLS